MKTISRIRLDMKSLAAALALGLVCVPSFAALVDIAPSPLSQTSTTVVKPNLMFVLDDSGSMGWDYMPDYVNDKNCRDNDATLNNCSFGMPAYNSAQFNTMYYSPDITYTPPTKYDGTSYPSYNTAALWAVVPDDGFGVQATGTTDLVNDYPDIVYCNTGSPSTAQRTAPFTNATTCRRPIQGDVWTYPTSAVGNQSSVTGNTNPYYYTITSLAWCSTRDATAGFGNGTCQAKQTATFQYPQYGSAGNNGFTRVEIVSTTANYPRTTARTDCTGTVGATGCSYSEEMTNFANWYAYYRTRMQMMKSAAGLAFNSLDDRYRVGFVTIHPGSPVTNSKFLAISDFTAGATGQRQAWYDLFYKQNPASGTPLREALSRVGRHFAGKTDGLNDGMSVDPIQYSCQQNFAILSTDGMWNGPGGKELDGTTDMGNYDSNLAATPRPLYDGSTETTTVTSTPTRTQVVCTNNNSVFSGPATNCGCTAGSNFKRVKQQTVTATSTVVSRDGTTLSTTPSSTTTYQDITACDATAVTTVTRNRRVEQQQVAFTDPTGFSAVNGITAGMNSTGTCAAGEARIKERTTEWDTTVVTHDGAIQSTTNSGTTYAFADIGTCTAGATVDRTYQVNQTSRYVSGEHTSGATDPTAFPAGPSPNNPQGTFSCSGSGTRTIVLTRTNLRYNKTVRTVGTGVPVTTGYGAQIGTPNFSQGVCDTSAKTATPANSFVDTLISSTVVAGGGPAPAATTNSIVSTSSTSTGSSITAANFTIPGGGPQVAPATSTSTQVVGYGNTLADVAQYYYITDLRAPGSLGAPVGSPATQLDVGTDDNVPGQQSSDPQNDSAKTQHMTTFTLGLGVDGTLTYDANYRTDPSGDFKAIVDGTKNWPQPVGDTPTAVDDLWHAAVNGRGKYFSAKNPTSLSTGLSEALANVNAVVGAAAAAATSTLEPVEGDNFIYVASYETVTWAGELEALTIDLSTNTVLTTAAWTAQSQLDALVNATTPGGQNRNIKRFNATASNKLEDFNWANLVATGDNAYFSAAWIGSGGAQLSQWASLDASQKTTAVDANLLNFIRGDSANERTSDNVTGVYRDRIHALGDIADAAPVYVKGISANYGDSGFATFKTCVNSGGTGCGSVFNGPRTPIVYIAGNDGMLHALDGSTGAERWAYVPNMLIPKLYRLADMDYANRHQYYVDGSPRVGNVYDSAAAKWKTILVGGLNSGGRGYYALDITDPANPKGLWEFTVKATASCPSAVTLGVDTSDCDLGFTYGNPVISKLGNGEWVVMVTSGYNNVSPGDGKGYLYVLDAMTGVIKKKIKAASAAQGIDPGDTTTPTGLAKITGWVDDVNVNNTTLRVYAGDMLGNLWRFETDTGTAYVVAELKDASNNPQPITTRPELAEIASKAMIYVGTGRYLGAADLTSTEVQTLYGIKDATNGVAPATPLNARGGTVVSQTLTNTTDPLTQEAIRTVTSNPVDLATQNGWRIDLPTTKERVIIDPKLLQGTLVVASNVPANTPCSPGGFSYLNFVDYKTGSYVPGSNYAGVYMPSFAVGLNAVTIDGNPVLFVIDNKKGITPNDPPTSTPSTTGRRSSWRELTD